MQQRCLALLTLTLLWFGRCLKVQNLRIEPQHDKHQGELKLGKWTPTSTNFTSSASIFKEPGYLGWNGSSGVVNMKKVKAEFANQLVLILGCSLDINAIGYFCGAATGFPMENFVSGVPLAYLMHCTVGTFTVVYTFTPGASAPPYSQEYNPAFGTTRDIIGRTKQDILVKFGREPSHIVVDASLWDVGNWWQKMGRTPYPYPIPSSFVQNWCYKDVPELLVFVSQVYPNTPIAFRTAPTLFANPNGYGLSPITVEEMVQCVELQKNAYGGIYSGFGLIDFHHFVDATLASAGNPSQFYKDSLHPGPQLSLMYINGIMTWVHSHLR